MDENPNNFGQESGPTSTGSMGGGSMAGAPGIPTSMPTAASTGGESDVCPTCGHSASAEASAGGGLEQFLGRLGLNSEMVNNLKSQFQNVDIDDYLTTARDYLKNSGNKAGSYAKENPGKVAAGVAALALGAGLIYAAVNRDKGTADTPVESQPQFPPQS